MKPSALKLSLLALPLLGAAPATPLRSLPYAPSLDLSSLDRGANPCEDFYQFTCGGWMQHNPIPAHQAGWSVYAKLQDDNQRLLWGLLEDAAQPTPSRDATHQKIGDLFASCMDEAAIERLGATPLDADLQALAAAPRLADLWGWVARQHRRGADGGMLFDFSSQQDYGDSSHVIGVVNAGGLGLPDRDYYLNNDAHSTEIRKAYEAHVQHTLALLGDTPAAAQQGARTVLKIETALARATLTRVEKRDPYKLYHRLARPQLQALAPVIDWSTYLRESGAPDTVDPVNVSEPAFLRRLGTLLTTLPLAEWKTYLRWHAARARSPYLSSPFVKADFAFYRQTLQGVKELPPRWLRCVEDVDGALGEALGQAYVERTFSKETRTRTLEMVRQIEAAMEQDLRALPWMGAKTREQALAKLHAIVNKIGYPDRFRDYGKVTVVRGDFAGNVARAAEFESQRQLNKIGRPVDRGEWQMSPPTVNAYYDAQLNDINFPAGVLQPPLFDPKMDDAPNYGNTGGTIGHELTHGFDDEGRQFDAAGNLRDWWTKDDAKRFQERAACVVDQYAQYVVVDDIHINSKLTLGEDVADLGGTLLAYLAWQHAEAGKQLPAADGFTPAQRFFIGYAQWACENERPERLRLLAVINPHSPGKYRVNGVVANLPQFREAFQCQPGQPMVRAQPCRVW